MRTYLIATFLLIASSLSLATPQDESGNMVKLNIHGALVANNWLSSLKIKQQIWVYSGLDDMPEEAFLKNSNKLPGLIKEIALKNKKKWQKPYTSTYLKAGKNYQIKGLIYTRDGVYVNECFTYSSKTLTEKKEYHLVLNFDNQSKNTCSSSLFTDEDYQNSRSTMSEMTGYLGLSRIELALRYGGPFQAKESTTILIRDGDYNDPYLQAAADRLWTYIDTSDESQLSILAYMARYIAESGNPKYADFVEQALIKAKETSQKSLTKHLKKAKKRIKGHSENQYEARSIAEPSQYSLAQLRVAAVIESLRSRDPAEVKAAGVDLTTFPNEYPPKVFDEAAEVLWEYTALLGSGLSLDEIPNNSKGLVKQSTDQASIDTILTTNGLPWYAAPALAVLADIGWSIRPNRSQDLYIAAAIWMSRSLAQSKNSRYRTLLINTKSFELNKKLRKSLNKSLSLMRNSEEDQFTPSIGTIQKEQ
ncbi:hypothetical protein [Agaribacterium sp. ZY112]|uniref:hypothetical protein n=1 Tax=Agaribacterium sp. ZY112 TaxID=3233574 RepID=UPI0035261365